MLKCREVSKIVAAEDRNLGFMKRMELKLHLFMCVHCRNYAAQIKAMGRDVRGLVLSTEPTPREIDDLENRICDKVCLHDPDQD